MRRLSGECNEVQNLKGEGYKQETLQEIHDQEFVTKGDLVTEKGALRADIAALKDELKGDIATTNGRITQLEIKVLEIVSAAKWQVIGSVAVLLFMQTIAKHFGF